MNISIIEPKNETHAPAVSNSLSGRRLALAWVLFVGAVGITLAVFFGSLPTYLALLQLTVTLALLYLVESALKATVPLLPTDEGFYTDNDDDPTPPKIGTGH